MRLKAFTGATLAEAMQQVREALGDNATIMLTEDKGTAVRVVASYDPDAPPAEAPTAPPPPPPVSSPPSPSRKQREWLIADPDAAPSAAASPAMKRAAAPAPAVEAPTLAEIFDHHGVPETVLTRLGPLATTTPLAERLEAAFRFAGPVEAGAGRPLLLAGPPGAGKTLAAAKLAARAVIAGTAVRLICADAGSAGAVEQLAAFTRPLGITVEAANGAVGLATLFTDKPAMPDSLVIIDSQGVNPFDRSELAGLGAQIVSVRADPVLVLPAGADAREAAEMAEAFTRVGCARLLATRLDIARRLGGILAAASAGLAFTEISASPMVAKGFQPLNPEALARLLVGGGQDGA